MIGVSIVTFRSSWRALLATVEGLACQTEAAGMLLVHANDSDAGQTAVLGEQLREACRIEVQVTGSIENLGFCDAHNANLSSLFLAGCSAVVVLNPDLILAPEALALLTDAARRLGNSALYGPILELADPTTLEPTGLIDSVGTKWVTGARHLDERQGEPMTALPDETYDTAAISGACIYVPKAAYDEVLAGSGEFFDSDFFAYREDAELGLRASLLGIPSRIVPQARGRHVRRLRGTQRGLDPHIDALGVKNRFLLAFKYGRRRPGGVAALWRDVVVVAGVLVSERSSLPALREAWQLRHAMREKGRRLSAIGKHP